MMKVCLDARKAWDSGIGTYIRGLLEGFTQIEADIEWDYIIKPDSSRVGASRKDQSRSHPCKSGSYSLSELFAVSRIANGTKAQIFHAPHYVIPYGLRPPIVVTVHDLIHLQFPQYFSVLQRAYAQWMFTRVKRHARAIITVSERTKSDLMRQFAIPAEKLWVIYHGVSARYFNADESEAIAMRAKYNLPETYLLFVGNLKPHKNIGGLISAWAKMADSLRPPLVMVGTGREEYLNLAQQEKIRGRENEILFLGEIVDAEMPALYRGARAYVQPSWYEGFGFPPLEAMASGIPVAVSNRGALPEVVGDAALIFDPADQEQFVGTLESIVADEALRKTLREKGLQRALLFSWETAAQQTYKVYCHILGRSP